MNYPYCLIKPNEGKIKVQLKVNNALLAGADFTIFDTEGNELHSFRMEIGQNGQAIHEINLPPTLTLATLNGKIIKWAIHICSGNPAIDTGTVEIILFQDDTVCPITNPLKWDITGIPLCSSGNALTIQNGLIFNLIL
jgi:hypothetical protein